MKWQQLAQVFLKLGLVLGVSGCFWSDENKQTYITGDYYTETEADTHTRLYIADPVAGEALLPNVSALGTTTKYLAVRAEEKYWLFVKEAASDEAARKTALGPLDAPTFRKKLKQLTGDSTLRLSSKF